MPEHSRRVIRARHRRDRPFVNRKHSTGLDVAKGSRLRLGIDLDPIFRAVGGSQTLGQSEVRSSLNLSDGDSRPWTARLRKLVADCRLQNQGQTRHAVSSLT